MGYMGMLLRTPDAGSSRHHDTLHARTDAPQILLDPPRDSVIWGVRPVGQSIPGRHDGDKIPQSY